METPASRILKFVPKEVKSNLIWTNAPNQERYDIYRSLQLAGPYGKIAETQSDFSLYLDTTVINDTLYYYQIELIPNDGSPICRSEILAGFPPGNRQRLTTVPSTLNQQQPNAENTLVAASLDIGDVETQLSSTIPAGLVIAQDPPYGSSVPLGFAINLVISSGPSTLDITITSPANDLVTAEDSIEVSGNVTDADTVTVNGFQSIISGNIYTTTGVSLNEGVNVIVATAENSLGESASSTIFVRRDTQAPIIVFETPLDGDRLVTETVAIAGSVNDIIPGATVNQDDVTVTVNSIPASVSNRTFFVPGFPLDIGENFLTAEAIDRAGNMGSSTITVTREPDLAGVQIVITGGNAQTVPINTALPNPLLVKVQMNDGTPEGGRPVTFEVSRGDGLLGAVVNNEQRLTVLSDTSGQAQVNFTVGSRTGEGFHRIRVTTPGSLTFAEFCATVTAAAPVNIAVLRPPPKQAAANQTLMEPILAFVTDQGGNPVKDVPVTFQVEQGGGNFSGSQNTTVLTNADGTSETPWTLGPFPGPANNRASATFLGNPGLHAVYKVSSVAPGLPQDTTVSGIVLDSTGEPIVGAKVVLRNTTLETFTDSQGAFILSNVSSGMHHVQIIGSEANDPSNDVFFPSIEYTINVISGVDNPLDQVVILPFLDMDNAQMAGGAVDVILQMEGVPGATLSVVANSTFVKDPNTGQLIQQPVLLSMSQVKIDKLPMSPPQGSAPLIVGTLQPAGIIFNPPAKVSLPNFDNLAPGDVADLFSFDHDIGQFVNIGPGTVSEDGSVIVSDPGFGIVQSGWFCHIRFPGPAAQCTNVNGCTVPSVSIVRISPNGTATSLSPSGPMILCVNDILNISVTFVAVPPSNEVNVVSGSQAFVTTSWSVGGSFNVLSSPTPAGTSTSISLQATGAGEATITTPTFGYGLTDSNGNPLSDATCTASFDVTSQKVELEFPTQNQEFHMDMSGPTMPTVNLKAKVTPSIAGLEYRFEVGNPSNGRALEYEDHPTGYTNPSIIDSGFISSDNWNIDFGGNIYGGHVTHVSITIRKDGAELCTERIQRDFFVLGDALTTPTFDSYLATKGLDPERLKMATAIAKSEGFGSATQFDPGGLSTASHTRYPLRDMEGGYGVFQLTNPVPNREEIWNWKTNVDIGLNLLNTKITAAEARLNMNPPFTNEQRRLETYAAWNGGFYYVFQGSMWTEDPDFSCGCTGNQRKGQEVNPPIGLCRPLAQCFANVTFTFE